MKMPSIHSLSLRFNLWALSLITLLLVVSAYVDFRTNADQWRESVESQLSETGTFLKLALPPALWNYQTETVERVLRATVDSEVVNGVFIVEGEKVNYGLRLGDEGPVSAKSLPENKSRLKEVPLYFEEAGEDPIATVYIEANNEFLSERLSSVIQLSVARTILLDLTLAVILYVLLALLVKRPIVQLKDAMQDIAQGEGDLTRRLSVSQENEIGELVGFFNQFMDKLQSSMRAVGEVSAEVDQSVNKLEESFSASRSLVTAQGAEIDSIATAITESTSASQEVAQSSQATSTSAEEAYTSAEKSRDAMEHTVKSIQSLAGQIEETSEAMASLQEDVDSITEIMTVIRGIAEQTNLLALNAAIEAARAGEQGRGFAVVADEVRSLAAKTQESTEEIGNKIERLRTSAERGVVLSESGRESSQSSVSTVEDAQASLKVVFDAIAQINDMSTQIATAVEEQSQVSQETSQNINRLSELSQQSSEQVDLASGHSKEVNAQTRSLNEHLKGFRW